MSEDNKEADVNLTDSLDFSDESESKEQPVEQQTTADDSSTEETKEAETTEEETEGEQETEEQSDEEQADETDNGESKAKNSAQNRIRSLANENRALKQQVEQMNAQFYQPQTVEQLQQNGMDETQAQLEAMRQEQLIEKANNHITALNSDINMESIQVTHDFPVFDPDSKEYDKDFAKMVADEWVAVSGLTTDQNTGFITQARVLPYDFYKSFAKAREIGMRQGAIRGQKSAEKTANAADITPIASSKDEKKDPIMEALLAD